MKSLKKNIKYTKSMCRDSAMDFFVYVLVNICDPCD